jgi:hypothetical protein
MAIPDRPTINQKNISRASKLIWIYCQNTIQVGPSGNNRAGKTRFRLALIAVVSVVSLAKLFCNNCVDMSLLFSYTNRLYYDLSSNDPILPKLCDLSCSINNFDLCDIQRLPGVPMENATFMFPMNWRFFPTIDPQVDAYLSRDLDSVFNEREIAGKSFYLKIEVLTTLFQDNVH